MFDIRICSLKSPVYFFVYLDFGNTGDICIVFRSAVCVGTTALSGEDMFYSAMRGKGVISLHVYKDYLWYIWFKHILLTLKQVKNLYKWASIRWWQNGIFTVNDTHTQSENELTILLFTVMSKFSSPYNRVWSGICQYAALIINLISKMCLFTHRNVLQFFICYCILRIYCRAHGDKTDPPMIPDTELLEAMQAAKQQQGKLLGEHMSKAMEESLCCTLTTHSPV